MQNKDRENIMEAPHSGTRGVGKSMSYFDYYARPKIMILMGTQYKQPSRVALPHGVMEEPLVSLQVRREAKDSMHKKHPADEIRSYKKSTWSKLTIDMQEEVRRESRARATRKEPPREQDKLQQEKKWTFIERP
ncbi:hypothetical protein V6N12_016233 [Hibiscus sabdariffa]|uniref:Uncharacterized protein n=1 Tax=Hibiscus sabdariffa TaxID=183260 RepID=A0ABR1ZRQ8_9ROSI